MYTHAHIHACTHTYTHACTHEREAREERGKEQQWTSRVGRVVHMPADIGGGLQNCSCCDLGYFSVVAQLWLNLAGERAQWRADSAWTSTPPHSTQHSTRHQHQHTALLHSPRTSQECTACSIPFICRETLYSHECLAVPVSGRGGPGKLLGVHATSCWIRARTPLYVPLLTPHTHNATRVWWRARYSQWLLRGARWRRTSPRAQTSSSRRTRR